MKWQNRAYCSPIFPKYSVAAERGAREGVCHGWHFAGAAFEGQKFGILVFALQCVTVSLYLFVIYSVRMGVAGWRGADSDWGCFRGCAISSSLGAPF